MPKLLADVTLDDLPTKERLGDKENCEYKIRIKFSRNVSPFDALNYKVSKWVCKQSNLNYNELSYLLINCMEYIKVNPEVIHKKGKLAFILSKYDTLDFLRCPQQVRERLLAHNRIENILYSPRSLGSEKWKELKGFHIYVDIYPGLSKNDFPHQTFIGVGYRDKGNSRNQAIDASPEWQEVCGKIEPCESKNPLERRNFHLQLLQNESWQQLRMKQIARSRKQRRQSFSLLD